MLVEWLSMLYPARGSPPPTVATRRIDPVLLPARRQMEARHVDCRGWHDMTAAAIRIIRSAVFSLRDRVSYAAALRDPAVSTAVVRRALAEWEPR